MNQRMEIIARTMAISGTLLMAVSCSAQPQTQTETAPKSPGFDTTCEEATGTVGVECQPELRDMYESHKDKLDAFLESGKLGMFNDGPAQDAIYAGLSACVVYAGGTSVDGYVTSMRSDQVMAQREADAGGGDQQFYPIWMEVRSSLCPDVSPTGYRSDDFVVD